MSRQLNRPWYRGSISDQGLDPIVELVDRFDDPGLPPTGSLPADTGGGSGGGQPSASELSAASPVQSANSQSPSVTDQSSSPAAGNQQGPYVLFGGIEPGSNNVYGIWRTDGTPGGTFELDRVSTIPNANTGFTGLFPTTMAVLHTYDTSTGAVTGTKIVFKGIDSSQHYNLWVTGGTSGTTSEITNIAGANSSGLVPTIEAVGSVDPGDKNIALFQGINASGYHGLWETDGTGAGTFDIAPITGASPRPNSPGDINEGTNITPYYMLNFKAHDEERLLFAGLDTNLNTVLWSSDATGGGTEEVPASDANQNGVHPIGLTQFGDSAYFFGSSNGSNNAGLWETNGYEAHEITGIQNTYQPQNGGGGLFPYFLTEYSGELYFNGTDSLGESGLWVTDGNETSGITGAHLISDGAYSGGINPTDLAVFNNKLYFNGQDVSGDHHLFSYDASTSTLSQVDSFAWEFDPNQLVVFNGKLLFNAKDASNRQSLWSYDGSTPTQFTTDSTNENIVNINPSDLIIVSHGEPDLAFSDARVDPETTTAGGQVDLDYSLNNFGDSAASNPKVNIYLSTDANSYANATLLEQDTYSAISSGGEIDDTTTLTLPANLAAGTYYLILVADPDDAITELDKSNNTIVVPIIVGGSPHRYNGHTYEFVGFNNSEQSWTQASDEAAAMGGYLATVTSQGEDDFIRNNVLPAGMQVGAAVFIGASDAAKEGVWKWMGGPETGTNFWNGVANGSPVGGQYTDWASGEPNNFGGNEDYAVMTSDGKWVDVPSVRAAGIDLGFVVEFNNRASDDLTPDGVSDIPFRSDGSGDMWFAAMSNGHFNSWNQIGGSDTRYAVVGVGDFYGAGTSDILFRNNSTGDTWFAAISNGHFGAWHQIGGSDTRYNVAGVGDFYGTGVDDILYRNSSTGDTWFEAMSNGTFTGWHQVGGSDTRFSVVGVGDLYGNGTEDVIFRNNSTGDTWLEAMSNGAFTGWHQIGGSDTRYSVVGVGDFYGMRKDDILFRNNSTGDLWFEAINHGTFAGWQPVGGSDTRYVVVGVGDYFGNGTDDILFRNNSTGDVWYAAMSNGNFNGWQQVSGSNTSYTVRT
jgi:hypothetical protein